MMCSGFSVRVYMPGRCLTGSRPLSTLIDASLYPLFLPPSAALGFFVDMSGRGSGGPGGRGSNPSGIQRAATPDNRRMREHSGPTRPTETRPAAPDCALLTWNRDGLPPDYSVSLQGVTTV